MLALLLIIAAICLIILNPFQGAVVIGAVTVGVVVCITLLGFILVAYGKKSIDKDFDRFSSRFR